MNCVCKVTLEAIRIEFMHDIDYGLLSVIAFKEGFLTEEGSFTPRVLDRGMIIARVGSRSDPGRKRSIFLYLFPDTPANMNTYVKIMAILRRVLDPHTGELNLSRVFEHNLRVIRLVEEYRRHKYGT